MAHRSIPPSPSPLGALSHLPPIRPGVLAAVGALVVVAAGWWLLRPAAPPVESTIPLASAASTTLAAGDGPPTSAAGASTGSSTSTVAVEVVVVQAAGAVNQPGVYELEAGSRVDDLVRRAGGLSSRADRARINLAAALVDGERIWIPAKGEASVPEVVTGGASPGGGATGPVDGSGPGGGPSTPSGPVDLNAATAEELDVLPGVGPATAAAIIAHREQVGPFQSVEDLLEVRGIGEAKLEQLRPLVTV